MLSRIRLLPMCLLSLVAVSHAQENLKADGYATTEQMIPMRDGVKLHTIIAAPTHSKRPLPFFFNRTPYGIDGFSAKGMPPLFVKEGMILVSQDIRGRHRSEGLFVMMRPVRGKSHAAVDEGTDAYDTLSWLLKHVPNNNGRAAMMGTSYDGWLTLEAAVAPHPALKLAIPMASPLDMFLNDDFHRNGAFRLSYGFEYCYMMETSKVQEQFPFDLKDTYDWYIRAGALSHVNEQYFHGKVPTWNGFTQHPNHDSYWTDQSVVNLLTTPKVPILSVGGFWDQEDPWGPQETYRLLSRNDPKGWNRILIGPWNHGGWGGSSLGQINFGAEEGKRFGQEIQSALAFYLKDRGKPAMPAATVFLSGQNKWRTYGAWPPKSSKIQKLYFARDRSLSFAKPDAFGSGSDSYRSDPANPVPYRRRPIEATYDPKGSGWYTWQAQDQRFLGDRSDMLTYRTAPLDHDVNVVGQLKADLFAATSGTDSDWVVKVIDEYPNDGSALSGYQLPINMEVVRARFRHGLNRSVALKPNEVEEYKIDLHAIAHSFLKGHRIVVQVQSSWFPLIDRNPQKFVPNIFEAKDADFQPATQTIWRDSGRSSCVELPVEG